MDRNKTIAGVVLTLNEEQDLQRALHSLSWCDELLVVDSGSTDRTPQVAKECGAQFLQHIQEPPFLITDQRNWALDKAGLKSDWVLFLDADEEVGLELAAQLRLCINSPASADAYELTPRYWFFGKWLKRTQGYPNWHPRLVKRGSIKFVGGVWESFDGLITIGRINTPYEHYAFSKGLNNWILAHLRYATHESESILAFLQDKRQSSIGTNRSLRLRVIASIFYPIRPLLRFLQKYVYQLGFLEGWQGLLYSLLIASYELMVVTKTIESLRKKQNLPL